MDLKNKGITWDYYPKYKFAGKEINGQNRRAYIEFFAEEWLQQQPEEDRKDPTIILLAQKVAKDRVNREKKHEKAYRQRKNTYKYKGEIYTVMDEERYMRFKQKLVEFEQEHLQKLAEQEEE